MGKHFLHHLVAVACWMLALSPAVVPAQEGALPAQPDSSVVFTPVPPNNPVDTFLLLLESIAVVAGLSALLYIGLRWYRGAMFGKGAGSRQTARITLLGSSILAPKKSVSVIRVLDHFLVLGMSDDNMNVLLDVPVDEISDELKQSLSAGPSVPGASFKSLLDNWKKS
ncbi:flagellar biosynthetic protein FliO [candidate division KSB1 bacterium]|nr:flagellar biosynthetic protein FliO [candidate division KSB1 bacterium]